MASDPVITEMLKARVRLLIDQPFYGQIIMHLDVTEAAWCDTAATDGHSFFYNREFIKSLTSAELLFLHAHEVLHVVFQHMFRRGERHKHLWNLSCDALVNYILVSAKIGTMPKGGFYDKAYTDDFSTEEIYALLEKRSHIAATGFDMHLDVGLQNGLADRSDADGPPIAVSADELAEIQETLRSLVVQAAQNSDPGKLPAGIRRMIDRLLEPKLNWRQILTTVMRSTIKHDYTYTRTSRRSWHTGLILPGQNVLDKIDVVTFIDSSGSITQAMVRDFLSECQGIIRTFRDFKMTIGTFDTKIYNVEVFTPTACNIEQYELKGGGGTMPSCCWDYLKLNQLKPHLLLIFTDGEVGNDWGDDKYCETIFIIHGAATIVAPYGRTVHYSAT